MAGRGTQSVPQIQPTACSLRQGPSKPSVEMMEMKYLCMKSPQNKIKQKKIKIQINKLNNSTSEEENFFFCV